MQHAHTNKKPLKVLNEPPEEVFAKNITTTITISKLFVGEEGYWQKKNSVWYIYFPPSCGPKFLIWRIHQPSKTWNNYARISCEFVRTATVLWAGNGGISQSFFWGGQIGFTTHFFSAWKRLICKQLGVDRRWFGSWGTGIYYQDTSHNIDKTLVYCLYFLGSAY